MTASRATFLFIRSRNQIFIVSVARSSRSLLNHATQKSEHSSDVPGVAWHVETPCGSPESKVCPSQNCSSQRRSRAHSKDSPPRCSPPVQGSRHFCRRRFHQTKKNGSLPEIFSADGLASAGIHCIHKSSSRGSIFDANEAPKSGYRSVFGHRASNVK